MLLQPDFCPGPYLSVAMAAPTDRTPSPNRPASGTMFTVMPPMELKPIGNTCYYSSQNISHEYLNTGGAKSDARVPLAQTPETIEVLPVASKQAAPASAAAVSKKMQGGYAKMDAPPEEKAREKAKRRHLAVLFLARTQQKRINF